jgi:hypothetical protein
MSPLERAARALRTRDTHGAVAGLSMTPYINEGGGLVPDWRGYLPEARTVIRALREPSDDMLRVYADTILQHGSGGHKAIKAGWRAMIDKLLEEGD